MFLTSTTHAIINVITTAYDKINVNEFSCLTVLDFERHLARSTIQFFFINLNITASEVLLTNFFPLFV